MGKDCFPVLVGDENAGHSHPKPPSQLAHRPMPQVPALASEVFSQSLLSRGSSRVVRASAGCSVMATLNVTMFYYYYIISYYHIILYII